MKNKKTPEANPCWKGYKMLGMKEKNGREVPNCVSNKTVPTKSASTKKPSIKKR